MADKIVLVVAPSGQPGGGMGRVKDYMLSFNDPPVPGLVFRELVTRDDRGFVQSLLNTAYGVILIWSLQLSGRLALVHVNLGDNASAVRKGVLTVLARASGAKVVVHLHAVTLDAQWHAGGAMLRWLIGVPFRMASTNIVLGANWRRWLIDDLRVDPAKVDVVANGVPVPAYPGRDHLAPRAQVEIVFIGNLLERKGVSDLIAALATLPGTTPAWRMTFAGGGDIAHYTALAADKGLGDRVRFAGWVDAGGVAALLAASDVIVLPSYHEGLPLVILEAMGAGTPVICTPVGAIAEFLRDGDTAIFVAPGDVAALAAALARMIAEPATRQAFGDAARADYVAVFSVAAFKRSICSIYARRLGVPA